MYINKKILFVLVITTILGFYSKFYQGPFAYWVNNSLGGVFYVIFWCLIFFIICPKYNPLNIVLLVFVVTTALEFLQLVHFSFLEYIRKYFLGRTLLGTSFTWSDIPYYMIGSLLAWLIIEKMLKKAPHN